MSTSWEWTHGRWFIWRHEFGCDTIAVESFPGTDIMEIFYTETLHTGRGVSEHVMLPENWTWVTRGAAREAN